MSRHTIAAIGKLIESGGREVEITMLRVEVQGAGWSGAALLSWGSILRPGICRLILGDGRTAEVIVDELKGDGSGGEFAEFRGNGPPPAWAPDGRITVVR